MKKSFSQLLTYFAIFTALVIATNAQNIDRNLALKTGGTIEIKNFHGRIDIQASKEETNEVTLKIDSDKTLSTKELKIDNSKGKLRIEVVLRTSMRVDLLLEIPTRSKVRLETDDGQINLAGDFIAAKAETITGTIYADVPTGDLKYRFLWSASLPRIVSDVELEESKEKSAGRFVIAGKVKEEVGGEASAIENKDPLDSQDEEVDKKAKKRKKKDSGRVSLNFRTSRGIILLNVSPNEVPSNLTERPLTNAAKAIIKSGDTLLTEAIRRASPKYFGDYASTLPPRKSTPFLTNTSETKAIEASVKKVNVQVVDLNNRAVSDLDDSDFVLTERGKERQVLSVENTDAPFNLVLLLDVSGSTENYVDFIRKAARNFVNTVKPQDKLSIVIFNEDVKTISRFTTDKYALSESLDTFDAGGGTAYYDSIAYVLTDTLRPMKGDRTAIVVLSDGDDNRSFLPFKSLLGSIQESGALVYPLYVPSGLIAASADDDPNKDLDPLRNRFLSQTLTSKAQEEGEELAKISGGVYYPISQLGQIQIAYNDIVKQLRTAYTITYRSDLNDIKGGRASPRLKVKVKKENTFVKLGKVVAVENKEVSRSIEKSDPANTILLMRR